MQVLPVASSLYRWLQPGVLSEQIKSRNYTILMQHICFLLKGMLLPLAIRDWLNNSLNVSLPSESRIDVSNQLAGAKQTTERGF